MKTVTIDPITRLEGTGDRHLSWTTDGRVANAYLRIPELRASSSICAAGRGGTARITTRICGVCPEAQPHGQREGVRRGLPGRDPARGAEAAANCSTTCSTPRTTRALLRASGPDFVVGPDAPKAERTCSASSTRSAWRWAGSSPGPRLGPGGHRAPRGKSNPPGHLAPRRGHARPFPNPSGSASREVCRGLVEFREVTCRSWTTSCSAIPPT